MKIDDFYRTRNSQFVSVPDLRADLPTTIEIVIIICEHEILITAILVSTKELHKKNFFFHIFYCKNVSENL